MTEPDYKRLWLQACDAYDRKNRSGCVCAIDDEAETIRSLCHLHARWLEEKLAEERERISRGESA